MKLRFNRITNFFIVSLLLIFLNNNINGQGITNYYDGPYIDYEGNDLRIRWVEKGFNRDTLIPMKEATIFERSGLPKVDLSDLTIAPATQWEYDYVNHFIALSDLHGQFDIFIELLKKHQVISENREWIFGSNHLIITGDHFSRGDKVMEILWFLFHLEKQAAKEGGHVHVLLGNHELMTLNNDLRYMNRKYAYTAGVLQIRYDHLFSDKSVLGQWLKSKNVSIIVNDFLFIHGGISEKVMDKNLTVNDINIYFKDKIMTGNPDIIYRDEVANLLAGDDGPLWYRGYADTSMYKEADFNRVLDFYNVSNVIVGHTSMPQILSRFNNKLIFIDCNIKMGQTGEVLIWDENQFFRGKLNGDILPLQHTENEIQRVSLFEYIHKLTPPSVPVKIELTGNIKSVISKKLKEEYVPAQITIYNENDSLLLDVGGRMRSRGFMRKQVCRIPPVKFDFSKKELKELDFLNADKLKFVFPCKDNKNDQEKLFIEYFAYELYSLLNPKGIKARLVHFEIFNEKKKNEFDFYGILIEDESAYSYANDAQVLPGNRSLPPDVLERKHFVRMLFFQYMIGNTDWSIHKSHNLFIVQLPEYERLVPLPYDYDYSGLVDQTYAVPDPNLPITSVVQRYFMPYKITEREFYDAIQFYQMKENEIMNLVDGATYMNEKSRKSIKSYLSEFFKIISKPESMRRNVNFK